VTWRRPDFTSPVRIVVSMDIVAATPEEAYRKLFMAMQKLPEGIEWESTDEWYGSDAEPLSVEAQQNARDHAFDRRIGDG